MHRNHFYSGECLYKNSIWEIGTTFPCLGANRYCWEMMESSLRQYWTFLPSNEKVIYLHSSLMIKHLSILKEWNSPNSLMNDELPDWVKEMVDCSLGLPTLFSCLYDRWKTPGHWGQPALSIRWEVPRFPDRTCWPWSPLH